MTPGTKYITVGGAVASDVHGKNHHVDGAFSSHVLDMTVHTGQGPLLGARENDDLFAATCGGMGLTGIILDVRLRLKKIHTAYIRQRQVKAAASKKPSTCLRNMLATPTQRHGLTVCKPARDLGAAFFPGRTRHASRSAGCGGEMTRSDCLPGKRSPCRFICRRSS